jgi:hypothetical protein
LILSTNTKVGDCLLRNTLAFLSFHISQTMSRDRDAKAFRWGEAPFSIEDDQSLILSPLHYLGWIPSNPSHCKISSQIPAVKRQETKWWSVVSMHCLQRGQSPQLVQPRFCNRSAVQSLFYKVSQAWFLNFGGAQAFQTMACISERTRLLAVLAAQLGTLRGRYDEHSGNFPSIVKPRFNRPVGEKNHFWRLMLAGFWQGALPASAAA